MSKLLVNNSEIFKPRFIKEAILRETDCDEETADKITTSVVSTIYNNYDTSVDRTSIRTLINAQFIKRGMLKEEEQNRKLGLSVRDFEELIHKGCKDNANMLYNPEMIAKYCYDSIAKEDALLKQPKRCREAYESYYYHCLSGNNNLIVKTNNMVQSMNIVDIIDNLDKQEFFVPSVNPDNSEISWKKITNGKCTGKKEVFEIEFTKGYKIECTSDHKFLKYYTKDNKFCKNYDICIDDFNKFKSYNSIRFGTLNYIPVENDDGYYLKSAFYGFFLGDGYLNNDKIKFHLRKEDKINYIKNILEKLNINYDEYSYQNDITISCNNFLELKDKYTYPNFKLNYTGLLEGLINSDGYITTHSGLNCNYLEFDTTNKFIGDLFFIACLTHNIRPSYQLIERKIENHLNIYRFIVQNNYVYNLLYDINLRDGHKLRLTTQKSNNSVYKTSGIYPKKVTSLGEQLVYNITVEDNHNYLAGTQGFVLTQNCHDLEAQELRSNCFNIDIRWVAKNGLDIDGKKTIATSKPAKSLYTLLRHLCEFFMASSCVFSGGLGYPYFNVFLAPYCKGMSYKDIKQSLQMFIFDVNQSLVSRGGQICFTSVGLEFKVPEWLENEPAIAPGGVAIGTYKDYESEAELLLRAYMEIKMDGDSLGRPFRFPNDIFTLREGVLDEYKGNIKLAHEYIAKFPTPYFLNSTHDERVAMGCVVGDTPILTRIDGKCSVKTFKEISEMLNADYGFTKTDNIEVQSIDHNKNKKWFKAKGFIKNENMKIYKVILDDGRFFECDENHTMILPDLNRINILDCLNKEVLMFNKNKDTLTTSKVIAIQSTDRFEDTYCFEVNDRMIIKDNILMGNCRTTNIDNWTGDKEKDLLNTGNFMYTSLNLPLIIMDNKDNWREAIKYYCDISREYLLYRKGQIEKRLYEDHLLDLLLSKDCETGEQLYDLDRLSYTIGFVGLNEAILTLTDGKDDILSNKELGKEILDIMNEKCKEYKEKDHLRWAVFSSPAESTAYKFGEYNKRKHPNAYVQGTKGNYYLTNSHHIRVSDTSNIIEHIRNGDYFHPQSLGGCIEHLWLGDSYIDPKSLFSLTQKIAKTNINYFDYDTAFSSCSSCGFSNTEIFSECPICESDDVITYDRVSGYYVPVKGFNKGKKQEYKDRYRHSFKKGKANEL